MEQDLESDINSAKILSGLKRLNIAYCLSIILGSLNILFELATKPIFSNIQYKLTLVIVYGSFTLLKNLINKREYLIKYISFTIGEILNFILIYFAFVQEPECSLIWIQLSTFVVIFYQGYLFTSVQGIILFSLKHTTEWTVTGLYFSVISVKDLAPLLSGAIALPLFMFACLYFSYLQDIDICRSHRSLEYSSNKIDYLVESITDQIFVIDKSLNLLFTNYSSQYLLNNRSFAEYISDLSYHLRYLEGDKLSFKDDLREAFNCNMGFETQYGVILIDSAFIEWNSKLVIWEGQIASILIGKNVTKLIQLEKVSVESQYKSSLLSTVSHELRTPINAIISMAQLIVNKNLDKEDNERIELIISSSTYLLCLINDLLDYSQIMGGCLKITKIQFNIKQLLEDCKKLIEVQLFGTSVKIKLDYLNEIPKIILTDPYRLKQIILNLLSNSKKFTLTGLISLNIKYENNLLFVSCQDTGIGIPIESQEKIFQQFVKLELPSCNPQGVGLGLYISNMLTYELGGKGISLISEPDKGSNFSFFVKVDIMENQINDIEIPEDGTRVSQIKKYPICKKPVLIVDDTQFNILAYTQILESEGFNCISAINGMHALEVVKKNQVSLILMDCEMPIMDGFEATSVLRQMADRGEIERFPLVIGCTAHSSENIRFKCLEVGMRDVLVKPCAKDMLLKKIYELLKN